MKAKHFVLVGFLCFAAMWLADAWSLRAFVSPFVIVILAFLAAAPFRNEWLVQGASDEQDRGVLETLFGAGAAVLMIGGGVLFLLSSGLMRGSEFSMNTGAEIGAGMAAIGIIGAFIGGRIWNKK